jgi:hypothetical protein
LGNFYFNYTLKGPRREPLARSLKGHRTLIAPEQNGCVVVLIETPSRQDIDPQLAVRLSGEFKCPLLSITNHDDDILFYALYRSGQLVDEYDSAPDYFERSTSRRPRGPIGGDAALLCSTFAHGTEKNVERILRATSDKYMFEVDRHRDLVIELNLSTHALSLDYDHAIKNDIPPLLGISRDDMIATE